MIGLREQFAFRFADLRSHANDFEFFGHPFSKEVKEAPQDVQIEVYDLKRDPLMKEMFKDLMQSPRPKNETLLEFYEKYIQNSNKYPSIMNHAKKMASIFGSTYTCEQLFSKMKHCKSQTRSNITDEHLNDSLRLATSKLKPNIGKLAREKQHHPSH